MSNQLKTAIGLPGKFSDNAIPIIAEQSRTLRFTARSKAPLDKDALLASLQIGSLYDTLPKGPTLPAAGGISPAAAGAEQQKVGGGH